MWSTDAPLGSTQLREVVERLKNQKKTEFSMRRRLMSTVLQALVLLEECGPGWLRSLGEELEPIFRGLLSSVVKYQLDHADNFLI